MRIFIFIFLIVATFQLPAQDEVATTLVKLNQPVPEFSFEDENGKTISISDYKGKTVLITFFATWCGPCRKELPLIQSDIYNKYKDNPNFKLLIFGREHSLKEVTDFKTTQGLSMPFYADKERSVYSLFASKYIPRNFLINGEGKIIFSETGFSAGKFEELRKLIQKNLTQ
ncbi:MAG: redoxin family protein [Prolixibacteraceae bacterium]|jgi:peroxiredoxin|nr:redoxin family protein [Prolixibacteraceae bacterium]